MRATGLKAIWRDGGVAYGAWLTIPSSISAEAIAHQGFDYVCVDMQHGIIGYEAAVTMLQGISTSAATPIVRVPWNEFSIINRMLDAGAMGIIVPMVNSADEARAAVSPCRYFPQGARSYGATRATVWAGADYFDRANDEVACIVMCETKQAVEQIEDIVRVPGVDAVYVGPADLSITLGLRPAPDNGGAFEEARLRIARACAHAGVTAGMHANASLAAKHVAAGYRMVTVTSDLGALTSATGADLRTARGETAPPSAPPSAPEA